MLVAGRSLGCAGDDAIGRRKRREISISPSLPHPSPYSPFPFTLYGSTKKTFTGKRLKKGNEIKFFLCRNIFLSGSMPPNSHSIFEEGAVFKSFKIVNGGVFQEEGKVVTLN